MQNKNSKEFVDDSTMNEDIELLNVENILMRSDQYQLSEKQKQ